MVHFGKRFQQIAEGNKHAAYFLDYNSLKEALMAIADASHAACIIPRKAGMPRTGSYDNLSQGERQLDVKSEYLWEQRRDSLQESDELDAEELADAEEIFVLALEGEFAKVEAFFRRIVAEMTAIFKSLSKRAGALPPLHLAAAKIGSFAELQELLLGDEHCSHHHLIGLYSQKSSILM